MSKSRREVEAITTKLVTSVGHKCCKYLFNKTATCIYDLCNDIIVKYTIITN